MIHLNRVWDVESMATRPGTSLVEIAFGIMVVGMVLGGVAGALASGEKLARHHRDRVTDTEARRVTRSVLTSELRYLDPRVEIGSIAPDSIDIRVPRGNAVVCAAVGQAILVRFRGLREPEPAKDSVIVITDIGDPRILGLSASVPVSEGCAVHGDESTHRWSIGATLPPGTLLLLFERGTYHLADGAFRYRRGAAGRQPLTTEFIVDDRSGFQVIVPAGVAEPGLRSVTGIQVTLGGSEIPGASGGARSQTYRIGFLNIVEGSVGGRPSEDEL